MPQVNVKTANSLFETNQQYTLVNERVVRGSPMHRDSLTFLLLRSAYLTQKSLSLDIASGVKYNEGLQFLP